MSNKQYTPRPVFDTFDEVKIQYKVITNSDDPKTTILEWLNNCFISSNINLPNFATSDYRYALNFLYSYRGSPDTFRSYRRDIERLLQWSWFIRNQSILKLKREDIEAFIEFCISPYKRWIGLKTVSRFKNINGSRQVNNEWRPFDVNVSKKDRKAGIEPTKDMYFISPNSIKVMFGILSSFYTFLLQENALEANPVALIRQKSKFIRKDNSTIVIRRLSDKQWEALILVATNMANSDPEQHERTLFIVSCLYGMYLRISELTAQERWIPSMNDFFKDNDNNWWFRTVGKGNKSRQIAVSNSMLNALVRYRKYLGLSPYPNIDENIPLISHKNNLQKPILDKRWIRELVQKCFDNAVNKLIQDGEKEEAEQLKSATVHWLRHTGISDDVRVRPREHVRDDAGHSSGAITDRYIDIELKERARSAKHKRKISSC